jgi:hypothetical protein
MQITLISEGKRRRFSTEDISAFVDFVRDNLGITDQKHLRSLFELTCREVGSVGVGFTSRSQKLAVGLGQRLLGMHMGDDDKGTNKTLVENLSSQFHTHSWPLSRKEAIEIGLPVNKERDPTLEALMWSLWLDMEQELLERTPFDPLAVVLNSPEGAKLLSPAPQLELPANAGQPMNYQASIDEVNKASKLVEPVEFETVEAIMESARLAYRGITKGKILASRQPDLNLHFNVLVLFKGWEKTTI